MKAKIYISGKITGTTDYMERFAAVEKELTEKGYAVVNPAKINANLPVPETTWEDYMTVSLALLETCDEIYMMPGWKGSTGAEIELKYALEHDVKVTSGEVKLDAGQYRIRNRY